MNKKRIITIAVVVVAMIVIIGGAQIIKGRQPEIVIEPPERPVKLMTVTGAAMTERLVYPGRLKASQTVELSFEVEGRLEELPIKEGDIMQTGDLIARLDQRDFFNIQAAERSVMDKTKTDLDRAQQLFDEDLIAATEMETRQTAYNVARAGFQVSSKALEDSEIRAPFAGILARRYVENLEQVEAKQVIALFQDLDNVEVVINIPESVVARAAQYDISFSAQFDPETSYSMELREFSNQADTVTKTFAATLIMPRPDNENILPGMTVSVNVDMEKIIGEETDTYLIPLDAIVYDAKKHNASVWIYDESSGQVISRKVETLGVAGELVEVVAGLSEGDELVIAGASFLFEGQKVRRFEG
jgi:RND family efflux transporter MFP subunit